MPLFGNSKRQKREAELGRRVTVEFPAPTDRDKELLKELQSYNAAFRLEHAVSENSLWCVFELLCDGADVNEHAGALQEAIALKDNPDMVKLLLQAGATRQHDSSYYMRDAVRHRNDTAVGLLEEYGAKVDESCILEALQQGRTRMADRLLGMIDADKREKTVRDVLLTGMRYDKPQAVFWVKESHPEILKGTCKDEVFQAAVYGDVGCLRALGADWLKKLDAQELARQAVERSQPKKLSYLMDTVREKLDCDALVQTAISKNQDDILTLLRLRGGKVTVHHVTADMLETGQYRSGGEGEKEFERRRKIIDQIREPTEMRGYLLSNLIRHNKCRSVEYLLQKRQDWPRDVVERGIVGAAADGRTDMLHVLFTKSNLWDAETYASAVKNARNSTVHYHLDKIRGEVLGESWQIESEDTIRRLQSFDQVSGKQSAISISHIFNFKSCEVARVTTIGNGKKEYVSFKDFREYQNDADIRTAYEKLGRFVVNPPAFEGVHMTSRKRPVRVIKRRHLPPRRP